jgi:hypothetical protein
VLLGDLTDLFCLENGLKAAMLLDSVLFSLPVELPLPLGAFFFNLRESSSVRRGPPVVIVLKFCCSNEGSFEVPLLLVVLFDACMLEGCRE